jgi:hypothetical protein
MTEWNEKVLSWVRALVLENECLILEKDSQTIIPDIPNIGKRLLDWQSCV